MKKSILIFAITITNVYALYAQNSARLSDTTFYTRITDPPNDVFKVGREYDVRGTAHIPSGEYLWVLCHRKGLPQWWPQNLAIINPETHEWLVTVSVGELRDIGRDFEIIAISVNQRDHTILNNNIGVSTKLPNSSYSSLRVVRKVSHD